MTSANLVHNDVDWPKDDERRGELTELAAVMSGAAESFGLTGTRLPLAKAVELLVVGAGYTEEQAVISIDEAIGDGHFALNEHFELTPKS